MIRDPNRQRAIANADGADVIRCITSRSIRSRMDRNLAERRAALAELREQEEQDNILIRHFTKNRDKRR